MEHIVTKRNTIGEVNLHRAEEISMSIAQADNRSHALELRVRVAGPEVGRVAAVKPEGKVSARNWS